MKKNPLLTIPVRYGMVATVINIILLAALYFSGKHPLLIPPFLDSRIILFLIFIYFVIRDYRDNHNNGYLHLWEGLIMGMITYIIVGVFTSLVVWFYASFEQDFINQYIQETIQSMEAAKETMVNGPQKQKMTIEEFNDHVNQVKAVTPKLLATDYFIKTLIIGFFIPLVYSVVFRKVDR